MKPGEARSTWQLPGASLFRSARWRCALLATVLLSGCHVFQPNVEHDLMANRVGSRPRVDVAERYTVTCPDVVQIVFPSLPELSGPHPIGVDGRLDLEPLGQPR